MRTTNPYKDLEKAAGYRFRNRALLEQAMTHPSYRYENAGVDGDNQRLEFLGDAVLGLLTASYVYHDDTSVDEGVLTQRRSQVTNGKALAALARKIELGQYLRMGVGEARSGGHTRQRNHTDAFEALFGAAWIDGGLKAAQKCFDALVVPTLEQYSGEHMLQHANPKGRLQEVCQARWKQAPLYRLLETTGPAHDARFRAEVLLPDGRSWQAESKGRQLAEVAAARRALEALSQNAGSA